MRNGTTKRRAPKDPRIEAGKAAKRAGRRSDRMRESLGYAFMSVVDSALDPLREWDIHLAMDRLVARLADDKDFKLALAKHLTAAKDHKAASERFLQAIADSGKGLLR